MIVEKGILYKGLPFSGSLLLLHPETMHKSGILSKNKEGYLSLFVLVLHMNDTEKTSQSKLNPFSCIVIYGLKSVDS